MKPDADDVAMVMLALIVMILAILFGATWEPATAIGSVAMWSYLYGKSRP